MAVTDTGAPSGPDQGALVLLFESKSIRSPDKGEAYEWIDGNLVEQPCGCKSRPAKLATAGTEFGASVG